MTMSVLGDDFCTWSGSYASKIEVMVFVAVTGYHAHAKYTWTKDSNTVEGEEHPII